MLQRAEPEPQGFLRPTGRADEMFVDVGAYGMPPAAADPAFDVRATVRKLEAWVTAAVGSLAAGVRFVTSKHAVGTVVPSLLAAST